MSQELTATAGNAPALATDYSRDQLELIKQTVAAGTSDLEFQFFIEVAKSLGLSPLAKQIYAIMRNEKRADGTWGKRMTIQTGIDGYRVIAARTGALAGIDDAEYDTEDADHPKWARVTVWRFVQGQRVPFTAKARWTEYVQTDKDGNPTGLWKKMQYLMLSKCCESLALRKAFPAELSGVYTHEEMLQAEADRPAWATDKQIAAMKRACQLLNRDCPTDDEMHAMTFDDIDTILDQYRREYSQRQESEATHD